MSDLERLARPFPSKYVKTVQGKRGAYVPHHIVTQALLAIVGPFDLEVGEVFYGDGVSGNIEGCLVTLTCVVDGRAVTVTEVGDCEHPSVKNTQGERMKDAVSDGVKRCAMRLGLGLSLWAQEDYFLYKQLSEERAGVEPASPASSTPAPTS